jgi:hypothetical protein
VLLVLAYNVLFVAPMLIVLAAVVAGGERGAGIARSARGGLEQYGAVIIPIALALLGAAILTLGSVGLARG